MDLFDAVPVPVVGGPVYLAFLRVSYAQGEDESYALPMAFATGDTAERFRRDPGNAVIADLTAGDEAGLLYGADRSPEFASALLEAISRRRRLRGASGDVLATTTRALPRGPLGTGASNRPCSRRNRATRRYAMAGDSS